MPDMLQINAKTSLSDKERRVIRALGNAHGTEQAVSLHGLAKKRRENWNEGAEDLCKKGLAEKVQGAGGYAYRLTGHGRRVLNQGV